MTETVSGRVEDSVAGEVERMAEEAGVSRSKMVGEMVTYCVRSEGMSVVDVERLDDLEARIDDAEDVAERLAALERKVGRLATQDDSATLNELAGGRADRFG